MSKSVELINIEHVTKKFDGREVLRDFSATVASGEIVGLIGKSGAGKSVLLHMLRGSAEYKPDSGRVLYHFNRCESCGDVSLPFEGTACPKCGGDTETETVDFWSLKEHDPLREQAKDSIAIMLQRTFALFGDKTVIENIMEAIPDGVQNKVQKAIELLEFVNMSHRTMHIARDLSGGEKQRIVMARQLAKEPIFFLADEPTGTLDPYTAEIVHNKLVQYVKENDICMIFASHWPEAIDRMADRAFWLDAGAVVMEGKPSEVTSKFMEGYHFEKKEVATIGGPIIRLTAAEKHYFSVVRGVVKAVDGVTFDVGEREVFGIIGVSGAGKTTTSRMIAGQTPATGGTVEVRIGDEWVDMSKEGVAGKGRATPYIGILHQEYTLYPFDTVLQNLSTCIGIDMPAELARMKAIQVLISVGFEKKDVSRVLDSYPDTLSVGECQRIAFAQVLIKEPRIIILDEPTGTMDPITKAIIAKSVLRARETLGETFVVVSHDMDFVQNCCDRAVFMKGGKVVTVGKPDDIVRRFDVDEGADGDRPPEGPGHDEMSHMSLRGGRVEEADRETPELRGVPRVAGHGRRRRPRPQGVHLGEREGRRGPRHGPRQEAHHEAGLRDHLRAPRGGHRHLRPRGERGERRSHRRPRHDHRLAVRPRPHRGGQDKAVQGGPHTPRERQEPHNLQGEADPQERGPPLHSRLPVPGGLRGLRRHRGEDPRRHAAGGPDRHQGGDQGDSDRRGEDGHHPAGEARRDRLQGAEGPAQGGRGMKVTVNGAERSLKPGATVKDALAGERHAKDVCVAVHLSTEKVEETTNDFELFTPKGSMVVRLYDTRDAGLFRKMAKDIKGVSTRWVTRDVVAMGSFSSGIEPDPAEGDYRRYEMFFALGGNDSHTTYVMIARNPQRRSFGTGGVKIGRVTVGKHLLDSIEEGEPIVDIRPVVSETSRENIIITRDPACKLSEGCAVDSRVLIRLDPASPESAEQVLIVSAKGYMDVSEGSGTFMGCRDDMDVKIPVERVAAREAGSVAVRNEGVGTGHIMVYRERRPLSPSLNIAGTVVGGMCLAARAGAGDRVAVATEPERVLSVGMTQREAGEFLAARGIRQRRTGDAADGAVVVDQSPEQTMLALSAGEVETFGAPKGDVHRIRITAEDEATVHYFKKVTGLSHKPIGTLRTQFSFPGSPMATFYGDEGRGQDLYPQDPFRRCRRGDIGVTNQSRPHHGLIGVRLQDSKQYGPTGEEGYGTNILGRFEGDLSRLEELGDDQTVYVTERDL